MVMMTMAVLPLLPTLPLPFLQFRHSPCYLLFLLFYEILLHRIILIMVPQQRRQFLPLLQHRPCLHLILSLTSRIPFHSSILQAIFLFLIVPLLILRMIHLQHPPHDRRSSQVIHGQVRATLILILEEREPFGLAGLLVADELDERGFPELGEDGDDVAFGEVEGEAADVDVGGVGVVAVPGGFWCAVCSLDGIFKRFGGRATHIPFSSSSLLSLWISRMVFIAKDHVGEAHCRATT